MIPSHTVLKHCSCSENSTSQDTRCKNPNHDWLQSRETCVSPSLPFWNSLNFCLILCPASSSKPKGRTSQPQMCGIVMRDTHLLRRTPDETLHIQPFPFLHSSFRYSTLTDSCCGCLCPPTERDRHLASSPLHTQGHKQHVAENKRARLIFIKWMNKRKHTFSVGKARGI